jgi:hypothetical protein
MPIIKHGAHRLTLNVTAIASQTAAAEIPYDFAYGTYGVYDSTSETVMRATAVSGAGTFLAGDTATLNHYNSAGALVDAVSVATTAAAHIPVDITASTASTGNRINQQWNMVPGDSLEFVIVATTTVGTRNVGVTLLIDSRGA